MGPIIYLTAGFCIFSHQNNKYIKNAARAIMTKVGGGVHMFISDSAVIYLEKEIYFKNECYSGVISQYNNKIFETNSFYIKNFGGLISCLGLLNQAYYEGFNVTFASAVPSP